MNCFVDTSAFLAVLAADDASHLPAKASWADLLGRRAALVTSGYVLVETLAVLQDRLGMAAVRLFQNDIYPVLTVEWVGGVLHEKGMVGVVSAGRRNLSLVDCVSFEVMRLRGIRQAFTFDKHFAEQGFEMVPA